MKKLITLLISGSLTLAAAAIAQPPGDEQQQDQHTKKSKKNQTEQTQPAAGAANEVKPGKEERRAAKKAARQEKAGANANANATGETNANANTSTEPGASSSTKVGKGGKKNRGRVNAESDTNANAATATGASPGASANVNAGASVNTDVNEKGKGKGKHGRKAGNEAATASQSASVAPSVSGAASTETTTNANIAGGGKIRGHGKGGKVLDQNVVQKVKTEHASFKAQPRPDKAPAVTFNADFRLHGSDQWQGPKYNVFRSYHPERHDHAWYHSHYPRVELIAGGYYYWNDGYWYPAWGYDTGHEYYAYDAPIYVGQQVRSPDQVIADVQSILQDAGYYEGEVDGLLGPLTRQALTDYQADNGLYTTAVIDEPTLESLGLS